MDELVLMYLLKALIADFILLKNCRVDGTIKPNRVVIEHEEGERVGRWWGRMFLAVCWNLFTL